MKILNKEKVCKEIENVVWDKDVSYMEAALEVAGKYDLDIETLPKYLSDNIKGEIEIEAEGLNLIPKTSRLPLDN